RGHQPAVEASGSDSALLVENTGRRAGQHAGLFYGCHSLLLISHPSEQLSDYDPALFNVAMASRTSGSSPAPPRSRCARIAVRIGGSQNFLTCSAILGTALSRPWPRKNFPI